MTKRKNSRNKGAVGERELAAELNRLFKAKARRGQQYSGLEGEDVVGLGNIHVECKRVEKLNIYEAVEQAVTDAKSIKIPAVFHRRNHKPWLVTVRLDDVEAFSVALQELLLQQQLINNSEAVII